MCVWHSNGKSAAILDVSSLDQAHILTNNNAGDQVPFVRLHAIDDDSNYFEPSSYGVVWRNETRIMGVRVAESEERVEFESGEARVSLEKSRMSFMEQRAYL
jgi:hypothetical protein